MDASNNLTVRPPLLNYETLTTTRKSEAKDWRQLPEKVLQFGTGVLLRGLVDWAIFQGIKQGEFSGRVVCVASTISSRTQQLNEQQGLFTQRIEGFAAGKEVGEFDINASISRSISAQENWESVLDCARNPDIDIIVSNTTEAGLRYVAESISASPPSSFPAKLTAFLYERFRSHPESGCVVLPTELISDNGAVLKELVMHQASDNGLPDSFLTWLETDNHFCNTLVDRIVTGMPPAEKYAKFESDLGFRDKLLTVSEVYRLWAIEGPKELESRISFVRADEGVVLIDDIAPYRERKLRILNGAHTISVALGFLYGLETVYDCLMDPLMSDFMNRVVKDEIVPSLPDGIEGGESFAEEVLDRFRNPFLNHKLLSITLQYTTKMRFRNFQTFIRYRDKFGKYPPLMCLGMAAFVLFCKPVKRDGETYFGNLEEQIYPIRDEHTAWWEQQWTALPANPDQQMLVQWLTNLLQEDRIWGDEIESKPLAEGLGEQLYTLMTKGADKALQAALS